MGWYRDFGNWQPSRRGRRLRQHTNPGLELIYLTSGRVDWMVDGVVETVHPGSLFFTLPWQVHGAAHADEVGAELWWLVIPAQGLDHGSWSFDAELGLPGPEAEAAINAESGAEAWPRIQKAFASERHAFPAGPAFRSDLSQAIDLLRQPTLDRPRLQARVHALVMEAVAIIEAGGSHRPSEADDRVNRWITEVAANPLVPMPSLEHLAQRCGLARTRFADLVKERTGDSPSRYALRQRLDYAAGLLRHSRQDITAIALDCGFSSSQYFARQFKAYRGESPSAYRDRWH